MVSYHGSPPIIPTKSENLIYTVSLDGVYIDEEHPTKEHTPQPTLETSTFPPIQENLPMTGKIPIWKMFP